MGDRLLRRRQVEEITGMRRSSIYRLMPQRRLPTARTGRSRCRQVEGEQHHGLVGVTADSEKPVRPAQRSLNAAWTTGTHDWSCRFGFP